MPINLYKIYELNQHFSCSNFLRVKFKVFNLPQLNMALSNSNIYKFKTIQTSNWRHLIDYFLLTSIWH